MPVGGAWISSISCSGRTKATVSTGRDTYQPILVTRLRSAWSQICSWLTEASPIVGNRRLMARWADASAASRSSWETKPGSVTTSCNPNSSTSRPIHG